MSSQAILQAPVTPIASRAFMKAFIHNMIWVNISGLPRYFLVVKPMLHAALPGVAGVAPVSFPVFLIWGAWTMGFLVASTGFYWMYFDRYGKNARSIVTAAVLFTIATIVLTWVGIANMGLAPMKLLYAAAPLALVEQVVAAWLVCRVMKRA